MNIEIAGGAVHELPPDMRNALASHAKALKAWQNISALARNEWICWTISVKKIETREHHIKRMVVELAEGKRRPCCWIGCIHRTDKPLSPSVKKILSRKRQS